MRDLLPGAVQPEHLAHVADDVADGLVLQPLRQRPLNPLLQVQVVNLIDLNVTQRGRTWTSALFLYPRKSDDGQDDERAIEASRLTDDERRLLTLYREMSDIDRRYIRCVAEVLTGALG